MIAPKHAQLAAIKDAINKFVDTVTRLSHHKGGASNAMKDRARALVEMDKAILGTILFDWQPMDTFPRINSAVAQRDTLVVFEDTETGNRFMAEAWADSKGTLFWVTDGDDTIHPDLRAVAWSYEPDSKALGGK